MNSQESCTTSQGRARQIIEPYSHELVMLKGCLKVQCETVFKMSHVFEHLKKVVFFSSKTLKIFHCIEVLILFLQFMMCTMTEALSYLLVF